MEKENARQLAIITSEIQQMAREDQDARIAGDASVTIAVDQKNKERLQIIIKQIGWPSKLKVGEDAAHAAWILVQHADEDLSFQRLCLDLMRAEKKDEVAQEDIAYLDDRIRVSEGQLQLYGTQWKVDKEKGYIPETIDDPENLDQRRADMGMEPFAEYSEAVQKWYEKLSSEQGGIKQYLQKHLGIEQKNAERIKLLKTKDLPKNYQAQRGFFHDERLDGVTLAVIPDDLWVKGSQPSESSAEKELILIKQSYFEAQENPDEIAWLLHELAHCQNFLDFASPEEYQANMQKSAFGDLKIGNRYPNNPVEKFAFTKQFQYLKEQGKSRENIAVMLSGYYNEEDFPFFNKLLDDIFFFSTRAS
ncbi:MAG: hypothetical protein UU69_C0032G0004 [Candidatus Magasanikbacteria bacterium GW2011_GWA2_41_55]|uniref:Uncharacterized protein n=1 Tax=Candidatus Magasanikbacteria bacterium GW2011_GWA2_41_55 TaxID=1619038 RepID=A0A0G0WI30_9BACT|nr:MAG: hypothetical protein UU69_C0032G0004 [Candidatus Magasanikbacteria bacterium GW2011_GWA2_41_55]HBX16411.1 hypothetical protein [Candidatus Magasanikbacteria bacterium]